MTVWITDADTTAKALKMLRCLSQTWVWREEKVRVWGCRNQPSKIRVDAKNKDRDRKRRNE